MSIQILLLEASNDVSRAWIRHGREPLPRWSSQTGSILLNQFRTSPSPAPAPVCNELQTHTSRTDHRPHPRLKSVSRQPTNNQVYAVCNYTQTPAAPAPPPSPLGRWVSGAISREPASASRRLAPATAARRQLCNSSNINAIADEVVVLHIYNIS